MHFPPLMARFTVITALIALAWLNVGAEEEALTFGNWSIRCEQPEAEQEKRCFIFQNLVLKEGGQRVMQIAVGYAPNSEDPVALISLPLGIALPPGAHFQVDEGEPIKMQIERCELAGCRTGTRLKPPLLAAIKNGSQINIRFHDSKREPIDVPISLAGFNEGLVALRAAQSSEIE